MTNSRICSAEFLRNGADYLTATDDCQVLLQSSFFSTPPLPCVVDEVEEVTDPSASHDGRKPKQRQRSQRRKDSKKKAEEQQSEINTGSPHKEDTLDALQQLSSKKYAKKNYCPAMQVVPYCH